MSIRTPVLRTRSDVEHQSQRFKGLNDFEDDDEIDATESKRVARQRRYVIVVVFLALLSVCISLGLGLPEILYKKLKQEQQKEMAKIMKSRGDIEIPAKVEAVLPDPEIQRLNNLSALGCLTSLPPTTNEKHMVPPPAGPATLVCCQTTKGILNIAVHKSWAPLGAARFLDMVETKFFSTKVGLFRALKGFLVQFGLAGDVDVQKSWNKKVWLPDDPSWLPLGPTNRKINGIKRFQKGYLAYAGAGKNSRGTQLIMAFEDNEFLCGGSPWEVPWGQLVGEASYTTLSNIYTGYGEKPSQGKIQNRGVKYLEDEFPLLDYITACDVVKRDLPWEWTPPPVSDAATNPSTTK